MENQRGVGFTLNRRIGSTNYTVNAYFDALADESFEDKISRMIQNEVLANEKKCGIVSTPQMSRPA